MSSMAEWWSSSDCRSCAFSCCSWLISLLSFTVVTYTFSPDDTCQERGHEGGVWMGLNFPTCLQVHPRDLQTTDEKLLCTSANTSALSPSLLIGKNAQKSTALNIIFQKYSGGPYKTLPGSHPHNTTTIKHLAYLLVTAASEPHTMGIYSHFQISPQSCNGLQWSHHSAAVFLILQLTSGRQPAYIYF